MHIDINNKNFALKNTKGFIAQTVQRLKQWLKGQKKKKKKEDRDSIKSSTTVGHLLQSWKETHFSMQRQM